MASLSMSDDDTNDSYSYLSGDSYDEYFSKEENTPYRKNVLQEETKKSNIIIKLNNRQIFGKVAKNKKSKTEPMLTDVHHKCKVKLEDLFDDDQSYSHIYMGFTVCSRFVISYREIYEDLTNMFPCVEYELYVWRFVLGKKLMFVSKHRIFKLLKGPELDEIMFLQHPSDPFKLYCYGLCYKLSTPGMSYLSILTLPIQDNCKFCKENLRQIDNSLEQGWCLKHGFMLHYMFTMSTPIPKFNPNISLSYPDHVIINTGHYIHILHTSCYTPPPVSANTIPNLLRDYDIKQTNSNFDNMSEISENSDNFSANSVVEAILEDFSEYDLESTDCNKPFHELNISCEPLNVTGRSYHNALVQNIVDPRLKRLQNKDYFFSMPQSSGAQKISDKPKIDRKIAEKAYEFTEENEKCEKLSSFRKKRLADKKYEFSEDNSENIVPFNSLRRERRFMCKSRSIKSPEFSSGLFLSPRSPGMRSPIQSPNSRTGQFSPLGRSIYSALRNSPHHSKAPISPRESARKFHVYSPSIDSDCSDYDSKLVLRQINNLQSNYMSDHRLQSSLGLLVVDSKKEDYSKWIKKVVRRYSSVDFENSSLVSGQSRDDYNIPIEIPIIVQSLTDQQLDIVPEYKADQVMETQLIVTQRSLDCEQFVQLRAQRLCADHQLEFFHCEDYDIKLLYVCPLDGHIVCQAVIKIGAVKLTEPHMIPKPHLYMTQCLFTWNINTDAFELIESPEQCRLEPITATSPSPLQFNIPHINTNQVLIMDLTTFASKLSLRDYKNQYEIFMNSLDDRIEDSIELWT